MYTQPTYQQLFKQNIGFKLRGFQAFTRMIKTDEFFVSQRIRQKASISKNILKTRKVLSI